MYTADTIEIDIVADRTFTYDCRLNGVIVGAALTCLAGEELVNEVRYRGLVDGGDPEAVEPRDEEWTFDGEPIPTTPLTLEEAFELTLTGAANPTCGHCAAPAFVSFNGHLYCKSLWQLGTCDSPDGWQGYMEPPICPTCGGEGDCPDCGAPLTLDEAFALAYAVRHVPLPNEERYGHSPACTIPDCTHPATTTNPLGLPVCAECDAAGMERLRRAVFGPGDVPNPDEPTPENEGDSPPPGWGKQESANGVALECPSCGDPWAHPGYCPACREAWPRYD